MRIYTEEERRQAGGRCPGLAGDFAVKEAVSKVFGTGFRGFGLLDIEVLRDELGKPWVRLHGGAKKLADSLKITRIHVSITNTRQSCIRLRSRKGNGNETSGDRKTDERDRWICNPEVGIPSLVLMERAGAGGCRRDGKTVWKAFRAEASGILRNGQ
ncbi:MAG: holo-ACP synthase [Clostridium fessum]